MAEPVIVPVKLEVTDIDTSEMNFTDVEKKITKSLSGIRQHIQEVFSGIDASAINKPIEKSMTEVQKSIRGATQAQLRLNEVMTQAGKSSKEYKGRVKALQTEIENESSYAESLRNMIASAQINARDAFAGGFTKNGNDWLATIKRYQTELDATTAKIEDYKQKMSDINPLDFIDKNDPIQVKKITHALKDYLHSVENINKKSTDFNDTIKNNSVSDEYMRMVKQAEEYKRKLADISEKTKYMEIYGGTESQWDKAYNDADWYSKKMDELIKKMKNAVKTGTAFRFGSGNKGELSNQIKSFSMSGKNFGGAIKVRARKNSSPYTKEYAQSVNELDKLEKKLSQVRAKYEELASAGAPKEKFQGLVDEANKLSTQIGEVKTRLLDMVNTGKAFKIGAGNAEQETQKVNDMTGKMQNSLSGLVLNAKKAQGGLTALGAVFPKLVPVIDVVTRIASVMGKVMQVAGKVGVAIAKGFAGAVNVLGKVVSVTGKVASAFGNVAKSIGSAIKRLFTFGRSGQKTSKDLTSRFKTINRNILMWGFGFRTAYYAIKRLRTIFIEGFKVMGDQFDEVGAPLKELMMSFERLKGSLATAFQPLVSVVMPILTQFMNRLSNMLETFAKFAASLTGQGHIYKAVAKDINSVAKASKNANRQLASYDKLEVIQKDNNVGYDYEKQEFDATSAASKFAEMVKKAWENADFTSVGKFVSDKLIEILGKVEELIIPKVTSFVNRLLTSINTFITGFDATAVGQAVGSIIDTIVEGLDFTQVGAVLANAHNLFWRFFDGLANGIDWLALGANLAEGVTSLFNTLDFDSWVGMVSGLANGITNAIYSMLYNINFSEIATTLGDTVANLFSSIDPTKIGNAVNLLFKSAGTFVQSFFETDAADSITTFMTKLITYIDWEKIGETFVTALLTMMESVGQALSASDNPLLSGIGNIVQTLATVIETLLPAIELIVSALGPIIESILPVITEVLPPIAEILAQAVATVLPVLVSLFEAAMPIITDLAQIVLPIILQLLDALQPLFDALTDTILPVMVDLLDTFMPLLESVLALVTDLISPILELLGPLTEIVFNLISPITAILDPVISIISDLCNMLSEILTPILEGLAPLFDAVNAVIAALTPIIELLLIPLDVMSGAFTFISGILTATLTPAVKVAMGIFNTLSARLKILGDTWNLIFSGMKSVIDNLAEKIKVPFNAILGIAETVANSVVKAINAVIKSVNKLSFDVPDWVPGLGGEKFGFDMKTMKEISIPRLAQGAVIPPNKEFLAMLGDQKSGTNIEAPLDTIKQALAEVLAEVGGGSREPIVLQVSGRTLAKVVWDETEKRYKQTGKYSLA